MMRRDPVGAPIGDRRRHALYEELTDRRSRPTRAGGRPRRVGSTPGLGASTRHLGPASAGLGDHWWPRSTPTASSISGPADRSRTIVNGVTTELTWPVIQMRRSATICRAPTSVSGGRRARFPLAGVPRRRGRPVPVLGASAWSVGLGAFPAPAPHTRPVRLAATAPPASAELVDQIGIVQGEIDVPPGVHAGAGAGLGRGGDRRRQPVGPRAPLRLGHAVSRSQCRVLVEGLAAVTGPDVRLVAAPRRRRKRRGARSTS